MNTGHRIRHLAWWLVLTQAAALAQPTPFDPANPVDPVDTPRSGALTELPIAIDFLDPNALEREDFALLPVPARKTVPPIPIFKALLGYGFSVRENETAIELAGGEQPAIGATLGLQVNRLACDPAVVRLTVGESFSLSDLSVQAYGRNGDFMEHVPLTLEIEGPAGFVDMAGFEADGKTLLTLTRGIGRLWVTSQVSSRGNEHFSIPVVLIVRERPAPKPRFSPRVAEGIPASP